MDGFNHGRRRVFQISAAVTMVTVSIVAVYWVNAFVAKQMNSSSVTLETMRHAELVEFTTAVRKASEKQGAERAKCLLFSGLEKTFCESEAKAEANRARTEARIRYKNGKINRAEVDMVTIDSGSRNRSGSQLLR